MSLKFSLMAAVCGFLMVAGSSADAAILAADDFNSHPAGDLVGNTPSPGPGGDWTNFSGSGSFIQVSGGQAVLSHGSGSREDAKTDFAAKNGGVLTAEFDLTVTDGAAITGTDFEYFALFSDGGTSNFRSRLDIVAPSDPNSADYSLGIATSSSTAEATLPTDYSYGVPIAVSMTFDFGTGLSSLTVGGDTVISTTVSLGDVLSAFALRQSNSSSDETISVDNLVVSHVPEPATLALMLFGLAGIGASRRRS